MALPKDVVLPRSRAPRFPAACVVCGLPDPEGVIAIRTRGLWQSGGNVLKITRRLFAKPLEVRAPACISCADGFRVRRLALVSARWTSTVVGASAVYLMARGMGIDPGKSWLDEKLFFVLLGVGAFAVLLPIEYSLMLPFDVALRGDTVAYEFANHELAWAFALENGAMVED